MMTPLMPLMPLITEMFHEVILKASFLPLVLSTAQSFEEKSLVQSSASGEVEISLHHQALKHFTLILMLHSFVTNISTIQDIQVWINFPI